MKVNVTGDDVCVPTVTVTENVYVTFAAAGVPEIRPLELRVRPDAGGNEPLTIAHDAVPPVPPA